MFLKHIECSFYVKIFEKEYQDFNAIHPSLQPQAKLYNKTSKTEHILKRFSN